MALLYDSRFRAMDDDGNPLSGATLTVYQAGGTTNLVSLYTDAGLTTPMSNPTSGAYASNAAGVFPQVFMAEGVLVDVILKDSGGSTVRQWDDVLSLGSDSGDLTRTLADDTRFKVRGSGGAVYIEAGDPSPDNSGGTMVLGGWGGTDADSVTINATVVNADGELQERGKNLIGIVHTAATTFTTATNVDIPLPEWVDGLRAWRITVFDLQLSATTGNIRARLAYDGVPTFKTGASDYHSYVRYGLAETTALVAAYCDITVTGETPAGENAFIVMEVITPDSGTDSTLITSRAHIFNNGATSPTVMDGTQYGLGGYGRATHLRLYDSSGGTLTGKYRIEALYGFGEA